MLTIYHTIYGFTANVPNFEDCQPVSWLQSISPKERAMVGIAGLVGIPEDHPEYGTAPFEIFMGDGFRIVSRRYASKYRVTEPWAYPYPVE